MTTATERYTGAHFAYHGISDDRCRMVRRVLAALEAHAGMPAEAVDENELQAFLDSQLEAGLHVNTVRKHANAIRPFFEWAWKKGLVDGDRYMRLRSVENPRGSTGRSTPRPYSRRELDVFWAALDQRWPLDDGHWQRRWGRGMSPYRRVWPHATRLQVEAMARLALDCGMRRDEIFRVELDDLHPDNAYIVVRGANKGARASAEPKLREVPYTQACRAAVDAWLDMRARVMQHFGTEHESVWLALHPAATPNNALYPSSPGAPIRHRAFKVLLATVGPYELHRLRHTCATERLRAGMKLENLSRFLGHSSIQQTLAYAQIVSDDIHRDAMRTEDAFEGAVGRAA